MADQLQLRSEALEWREVEGEVVAVDVRTGTYLTVNRSGVTLWNALSTGASRDQLVDVLERDYALSREQADADVEVFLDRLRAQDILVGA